MRPAWSWAFQAGALEHIDIDLPHTITPEWAWGESTGAGVKVAVLDSGVDAAHPWVRSVEGAVAVDHDPDAPGNVRFTGGPHEDLFGHGTACAGIIRKIAPDCEIHSVRVLGRKLSGKPTSTIGFEKRHNKAFAIADENEFVATMPADVPPPPARAAELRAINSGRTLATE